MGGQNGSNVEWYTGPLFFGSLVSFFLAGSAFVQAVYFFQKTRVSRRHAYEITLVSVVSFLELASIVVATLGGYYILCIAVPRGDLSFQAPSVSPATVVFNTLITVIVQGHFALRIRLFSQGSLAGKVIVLLIAVLILMELGSSVGLTYVVIAVNRELWRITHAADHSRALLVFFISTALADIVISAALVYTYMQFRKNTERQRSKGWLNGLIVHTIENGAVTSIGAVLHFAFYIGMPNSLMHLALAYAKSRLYSNVLFASINANQRLRREARTESETSVSLSNASDTPSRKGELEAGIPPNALATATRRHSLSGPVQRLPSLGTRTEGIEFTAIESSMMSGSGVGSERYIANA
ncbi:hypothetical protein FA13DRAFT_1816180 [Coprinellus micaceus]|uniref:DUF6534 domain-containing protein n=1 Tax=Coprinellus micaceus TaxID=71717 RepID=A0A4Y7T0N3_COPMI|nr:hypothetical protein FA13DRAFT_1816180 [Coprinellus micaceus]